jgi:glycine cleavage system H lipoate-binding protein
MSLSNASGAMLRVSDQSVANPGGIALTIANGFTNSGTIELVTNAGNCCGPSSATLNVTTGTLTNATGATIRSTGLSATTNTLNAQVTNQGTIEVNQPLAVTNASRTFTSSAGTLNVASAQTLTINDGTTTLGAGTAFSGSGKVKLAGTSHTLNLASDLTLATSTGVALDLNGTSAATVTSGTAGTKLIVPVGGELVLSNDTISSQVDLANSGTVIGSSGSSTINGGVTNASGATLRVADQTVVNPGGIALTIANGFTNSGTIELVTNAGNCCGPSSATLNVTTGTLTNATGATIRSTGLSATTNTLNAQVTNQGTIEVNQPLAVTNASRTFTSSAGTLNVASAQTLTINDGTTTLGAGTAFSGSGKVKLAGTSHTLNLASDLTLATSTGVALDLNGTSAATVTSGTAGTKLIVPVGGELVLSNDTISSQVDLANSGTVIGSSGSSTINGGVTNASGATLRVADQTVVNPGGIALTIANGFTNSGTIELVTNAGNCCGPSSATLNVTTGTLTNATGATIRSTGLSATTNTLNAQVTNQGTIEVNQPLAVTNASRTFTSSAGTLNVASAQTLTINDGTTTLGAGTAFSGSGKVKLAGTSHTLNLASDLTLATSTGVALDLNRTSAVTVTSGTTGTKLIVPVNGELVLSNSTISSFVDLANSGTVIASTGSSTINGGVTNASGATLRVSDLSVTPDSATLTVANGFSNSGTIELLNNNGNCCGARAATLNVSVGTLTNTAGGTIRSAGTSGATNTLNAQVTNQGAIEVNQPLTISTLGSNSGQLTVASGSSLTATAGFTNTGILSGSGTISVGSGAAKLVNQGTIKPGGTGAAGTLTVAGDLQLDTRLFPAN